MRVPERIRRLIIAAGLLFAVFFVDSLGFMRLVESPYVTAAWQSFDLLDRGTLIGAHVAGALVGGIFYSTFDERFPPWIFGIFALVAMIYVLDVRIGAFSQALVMAVLYAVAVSLYTVITFALWPDLSTPSTITRNVAIGVAVSGWTATFVSTAVALAWRSSGMDFERHLSTVAAVSLLILATLGSGRFCEPRRARTREPPVPLRGPRHGRPGWMQRRGTRRRYGRDVRQARCRTGQVSG